MTYWIVSVKRASVLLTTRLHCHATHVQRGFSKIKYPILLVSPVCSALLKRMMFMSMKLVVLVPMLYAPHALLVLMAFSIYLHPARTKFRPPVPIALRVATPHFTPRHLAGCLGHTTILNVRLLNMTLPLVPLGDTGDSILQQVTVFVLLVCSETLHTLATLYTRPHLLARYTMTPFLVPFAVWGIPR